MEFTPLSFTNRKINLLVKCLQLCPQRNYDGKVILKQIGLRTMPTNLKVFLRSLLTMQEKQILTRKLGVTTHFLKIINQQYL